MSHTHTPEPWEVLTGTHPSSVEISADGRAIAEMWLRGGKIAQDNARRIVACVNACAGVTTENLERNRIGENIIKAERQRDELQQQRDTLLAALNALYSAVDSCVDLTPQVMQQARAAIASIESPT